MNMLVFTEVIQKQITALLDQAEELENILNKEKAAHAQAKERLLASYAADESVAPVNPPPKRRRRVNPLSAFQLALAAKGIKQKSLALLFNVHEPRITDFIQGKRPWPKNHTVLLAAIMQTTEGDVQKLLSEIPVRF